MASGKPRSTPSPRPSKPGPPQARSGEASFPTRLLGAGLIIGLYAMLPAFFTAGIHVRKGVEVVDHVVPGVLVLAVVLLVTLRGARPDVLMLGAGVVVVLAGFWMAATHTGLASQAFNHRASAAGAAYHCSTAVLVLSLGVAWVYRYRAAGGAPAGSPSAARGR